jgi:hypothetical protein
MFMAVKWWAVPVIFLTGPLMVGHRHPAQAAA